MNYNAMKPKIELNVFESTLGTVGKILSSKEKTRRKGEFLQKDRWKTDIHIRH